jgi:hypothetical protein
MYVSRDDNVLGSFRFVKNGSKINESCLDRPAKEKYGPAPTHPLVQNLNPTQTRVFYCLSLTKIFYIKLIFDARLVTRGYNLKHTPKNT